MEEKDMGAAAIGVLVIIGTAYKKWGKPKETVASPYTLLRQDMKDLVKRIDLLERSVDYIKGYLRGQKE